MSNFLTEEPTSPKKLNNQNNNIINLREYRDIDIQSTVSAGTGVVDLDANHTERISYNGFFSNEHDTTFRVQGDSMEPMCSRTEK